MILYACKCRIIYGIILKIMGNDERKYRRIKIIKATGSYSNANQILVVTK